MKGPVLIGELLKPIMRELAASRAVKRWPGCRSGKAKCRDVEGQLYFNFSRKDAKNGAKTQRF